MFLMARRRRSLLVAPSIATKVSTLVKQLNIADSLTWLHSKLGILKIIWYEGSNGWLLEKIAED